MKLPVLSLLTRAGNARPADRGQQPGPAEQLERAGLREGQPRLARLIAADSGGRQEGSGTRVEAGGRLLLEVGRQRLPVRSDQSLDTGTLVRVMRAGNELRLLESLQQPSRSTLSQSLASRMPFQHDLGQGLNRLAAQSNDPSLPQQIRQGLAQLTRLMPSAPAPQPSGSASLQPPPAPTLTIQGPLKPSAPGGQQNLTISSSRLDSMTGPQVRDWIQQSGLFREAGMLQQAPAAASGSPDTRNDLKGQLIRLAAQLLPTASGTGAGQGDRGDSLHRILGRLQPMTSGSNEELNALRFPSPPSAATSGAGGEAAGAAAGSNSNMNAGEMLRLLAGMINRLTVNQLHSQAASTAGDANTPNQTWILELPWVTGQQEVRIVQARLEDYEHRDPDAEGEPGNRAMEHEWQLTLALSFDTTGPLYFEVNLHGRQLRTRVWAEKPATVDLVEATRERLETALARLDLDVVPVECMEGQPPARVTRLTQQLVDEHA